jgi:S1-C subfamily serine protease
MILMTRACWVLATLLAVVWRAAGQDPSVLHIKVVLMDADRKPMPVPRHALLISDNPATAAPRRVLTAPDGTVDVRLRPGNYTVESDIPVAYNGKAYDWTQIVDIVAGRDAVLELTAENAEVTSADAGSTSATPLETDESLVVAKWQPSVLTLWTPTARASGFLIGADGLLTTSQRSIGTAKTIEVQITPSIKVTGIVLAADTARDVAVLRVDPAAVASTAAVPLKCAPEQSPHVASGQKIFTIDAPLRQQKSTVSATAGRITAHEIESDFYISAGSAGGPVFTVDGLIGITSALDDQTSRHGNTRVVPIEDVCDVVATARERIKDASTAPSGAHLPVEPEPSFPVDALKEVVQRRAGNLNPYQSTSSSFDVFFLTPVLTYGAEYQAEQRSQRERGTSTRPTIVDSTSARVLTDFGSWSEYVSGFPAVLLVRLTPKLVEGFWTKVARGAAQTQGLAIPPIKRFTSGFSRMRAYCGDAEVTPIHPFKIERPVSETDTIQEGLYVFDPGALSPSCSSVKLMLYSEKEPAKPDTLIVDSKIIQRIWDDFTPYRALK